MGGRGRRDGGGRIREGEGKGGKGRKVTEL